MKFEPYTSLMPRQEQEGVRVLAGAGTRTEEGRARAQLATLPCQPADILKCSMSVSCDFKVQKLPFKDKNRFEVDLVSRS